MATSSNRTLFQAFEWHTPSQPPSAHETHSPHSHYHRLTLLLPKLINLGFTAIWLPPGCKANNPHGNGYDCYDLWDLGEFDQKASRATKWGSREELSDLIKAAHLLGLEVIWDAVLNHKAGGDGTEETWAVEVDPEDRNVEICSTKKIRAWLRYDFHGRSDSDGILKYSPLRWRTEHFNGTDWDDIGQRNAIYKLVVDPSQRPPSSLPTKGWAEDVDEENGNADYLMLSNIDYKHPIVREDAVNWGQWMIHEVGVDGFRLDAAQHFSYNFTRAWIESVKAHLQQPREDRKPFVVGEIWSGDISRILRWLDAVGSDVYAYDSPLVYNFSHFSQDMQLGDGEADLRALQLGTLVDCRPDQAVTLVTNHDTQPGQTSYTPMDSKLKALFYAFILLRDGGYPCVFWGDLFGTNGPHAESPSCLTTDSRGLERSLLPSLITARRIWAYGDQKDYFDQADCIGWTRAGDSKHGGCAVMVAIETVPSNPSDSVLTFAMKAMRIGRPGEVWVDILNSSYDRKRVIISESGIGMFRCRRSGVAVFVKDDATATSFPTTFDSSTG